VKLQVVDIVNYTKSNIFFGDFLDSIEKMYTGWAKLNGANEVSFVVVKCFFENPDNLWQVK